MVVRSYLVSTKEISSNRHLDVTCRQPDQHRNHTRTRHAQRGGLADPFSFRQHACMHEWPDRWHTQTVLFFHKPEPLVHISLFVCVARFPKAISLFVPVTVITLNVKMCRCTLSWKLRSPLRMVNDEFNCDSIVQGTLPQSCMSFPLIFCLVHCMV